MSKKVKLDHETRIKMAMLAMRSGNGLVYSEAVQLFNVRRSTLHDHMSNKCAKFTKGRDPLLTQLEEKMLLKILHDLQKKGYVITPEICRMAAYLYARMCNYNKPSKSDKKMAGRKWFSAFIKRNNIRMIENVSKKSMKSISQNCSQIVKHKKKKKFN